MNHVLDAIGFYVFVAIGVIGMAPHLVRFVVEKWRATKAAFRA